MKRPLGTRRGGCGEEDVGREVEARSYGINNIPWSLPSPARLGFIDRGNSDFYSDYDCF